MKKRRQFQGSNCQKTQKFVIIYIILNIVTILASVMKFLLLVRIDVITDIMSPVSMLMKATPKKADMQIRKSNLSVL